MLNYNFIQEPIQWLQSPQYLMPIMIIVTLWSSMGVGFLAMLAGILEINPEMYEAGALDGISNRVPGDHLHHHPIDATAKCCSGR